MRGFTLGLFGTIALTASGCILAPPGTDEMRRAVEAAGMNWQLAPEERALPELSAAPTWPALLEHAFRSNGELEAAYFEWQAAVSRIDVAAGYPNTDVAVNFGYLFSRERMKAWDRATLAVGFNPMQNLAFPTKVAVAGRIALAEAQQAASRLSGRKFDLQRRVLRAFFEYALAAERLRLQRESLALWNLSASAAGGRVAAGGTPQDLTAITLAMVGDANQIASLENELAQRRSELNALVGRRADATLDPPTELPPPRCVDLDDQRVLALGVDRNSEVDEQRYERSERVHALELARMQYIPDINPVVSIRGGAEQMAGAMVMFATTLPQIRARIAAAAAELRAGEAALRQVIVDRAASLRGTLLSLRNQERQVDLFRQDIVPIAELSAALAERMYVSAGGTLADWLDAKRVWIEARRELAEARMAREIRCAELEALAGVDFEALEPATSVAAASQEVEP